MKPVQGEPVKNIRFEVIIRVAYYLTAVAADVEIKLCRAGFEREYYRHLEEFGWV